MNDSMNLVLGRYDIPNQRKQENYSVDIYISNLCVFGTVMSGKTTLLKTLLIRLHQVIGIRGREEVYILDFGNGLIKYQRLPYVAAYFSADNEENIRRMFRILEDKLIANQKELNGTSYLDKDWESRPNHITFILDGLNAFLAKEEYSSYHEDLLKLSREGLSKGISIVLTANEPVGGVNRYLPSFNRIIAFDLHKDKYAELFGGRVEKPIILKGRGIINIDSGIYEFQAYYPYNPYEERSEKYYDVVEKELKKHGSLETEDIRLVEFCAKLNDDGVKCLEKLKCFDSELTVIDRILSSSERMPANWSEYSKEPYYIRGFFTAGLDYYTFMPIRIQLETAGSIGIYGKENNGKHNLLLLILDSIVKINKSARFVFWVDSRYDRITEKRKELQTLLPENIYDVEWAESREEFVNYINKEHYFNSIGHSYKTNFPNFQSNGDSAIPPGLRDHGINSSLHNTEKINENTSHPFTVFIVQSRTFFQSQGIEHEKDHLAVKLTPYIIDPKKNNCLFIFPEIKNFVSNIIAQNNFNSCIFHAFLTEDIIRFINNKGQKSVFGTQDPSDLRNRFGHCGIGDAFYFNVEKEELTKLKVIKFQK